MRDVIHWGILAPGRIARKFAHDLHMVEGARLHAVASRSLERAQDFAREFGARHVFGSYEELVSCPDLDVVYIASPHTGHFEHTLMCLRAGLPVLCEKPLAMDAEQVKGMIRTAREQDVFLMDALWTRFIPSFDEALTLVREGLVGQVRMIRADFGFRADFPPSHRLFNRSLGGGALLDVGIYPLFLTLQVLGMPADIQAKAVFGPTGVDESCAMLLSYSDGGLAILDASVAIQTGTEGWLYGDQGTLHLPSRFHHPEKVVVSWPDKPTASYGHPYIGYGYYHEIVEVMDCLRQGRRESERLPLSFSLELITLLDRVREVAGIRYPLPDRPGFSASEDKC
ncbi:MAG: hypothetical protein RLY31_1040 [Bacteroidota bacterium]|jgi:predicted dehydrogenase